MPIVKKVEPVVEPLEKKTILFLSDHPLAPSGVGVQARQLIEGLLKTKKYRFLCLGGALKHHHYGVGQVTPDFIIKPVDGFGDKEAVRRILMTERPDAIVIFTDPRQFIWLWEAEDEIHQICPIAYWHVWDNDPYPVFNRVWYESTELVNCLSHKTYEMVKPNFPEEGKVNYIPHAFPKEMYFPIPEKARQEIRRANMGPRAEWFTALWVNRNATRKLPSDVMEGWKLFLDRLEKEDGHRKAVLIMHTDPADQEGPNLHMVQDLLGLQNNVMFSTEKVEFKQMNLLHNMADCTINIAKNEGFGLSTLISLQCGKPIIALKTGGLTRQVIDHRDGTELGVAIKPVTRKLVGSQMVPFIYEDFASQEDVANAFMKIYRMSPEEKKALEEKMVSYAQTEFSYEKMISEWDRTLTATISEWETKKKLEKRWALLPLNPVVSTIPANVVKDAPKPPPVALVKPLAPNPKKMDPAILTRLSNIKGKK